MKLTFSFLAVLAVLAIISGANAQPMCTPMSDKDKAMYEEALDTDFMGCTLTPAEGLTALRRVHWLSPAGGMPIIEMDYNSEVDMTGMGHAGSAVTTAMKVAAASAGRAGMLTVSTECLISLEPDFIYSCMAKSKTPKEYNAHLAAACQKTSSRTITTSVRASEETIAVGTTAICIITSLLALFFPILTAPIVEGLKNIVTMAFTTLPCPSMTPLASS